MRTCDCPARFSPVCLSGNHTFYSACHAGCSEAAIANGTLVLSDCSCGELMTADKEIPPTSGYCRPVECPAFTLYLVITCLTKLLDTSSFVIVFLVFFRCVAEREKDIGIGVFNAMNSLFAFVCAPLLVGLAVDESCLLWERTCGQRGFCHLYDLDDYRLILHGIPAGGMVICCLIQVALVTRHHLLDLYGEREETVEKPQDSSGKQNWRLKMQRREDKSPTLNTR
ncbi:solute carrier organic anion transporter family member 74D-like [Oratosquilla oratoria]|uniref:solute carrier organic anion transporter family member 74D-like n=1 Tax=Oratosquilla oratoria TaxID=337810 RepID=UPI003F76FAB4